MTENVRKRLSKWDRVPETDFPPETGQENVQPVIAHETSGDESKMDHKSLEGDDSSEFSKWPSAVNSTYSRWPDLEAENVATLNDVTEGSHVSKWSDIKSDTKDCSEKSNQEGASGRDEWRTSNVNQESSSWDTIHDSQLMSPIIDAGHQPNPSISPRGGWNKSQRSRSQSRSRSRSRSGDWDSETRGRGWDHGWVRKRSRSRSPVYGFKRGGEGWNEKRRTGSAAPCRAFMAGRCTRGSQCRYLHEDGGRRPSSRHHDAVELGENRYERGQSPGYHSKEHMSDTMGQGDYSEGKAPRDHTSHCGGQWQKPEPHKSSKENAPCYDFKRGRCQRGSACKYVHHNASTNGGWELKGRTRDRLPDEGESESFGPDRRHDFRRVTDTPCKFFAEGRCRNGDKCRFSHQDVVQSQPEGRSCDFKFVQNSDSENKLTWNDPTWENQQGSVAAANASEWERRDASSTRAAVHTTVGQESAPAIHDQQLHYAEDNGKYTTLSKDVSQKKLPGQGQSSSHEISNQQHQYISSFSAEPVSQNAYAHQHVGLDLRGGTSREKDSVVIDTLIPKIEETAVPCKEKITPVNSSRSQDDTKFIVNSLPSSPGMSGQSCNQIGQSQYMVLQIPQPCNAQSLNLAGQTQEVVTPAPLSGQNQQPLVGSLLMNGQTRTMVPQTASSIQGFNMTSQSQQIPSSLFNGQTQQIISHLRPPSGQSQSTTQPPQNANFGLEKQSQHRTPQSVTLDNQTQIVQEGQMQRPDNVWMKASQTISDTPMTQRVVASEQVPQLSNLSASLAQIFGNGPQLPQLFAALNPHHTGVVPHNYSSSVGALESTTATYVQPNQGSWTQHQHGPVSDNNEPGKATNINMPPGFSSDSIENKNTTIAESAPVQPIAPLSATDGPTKTVASEDSHEAKLVDMNSDKELKDLKGTAAGLSNKEQLETGHLEGANASVRADGSSNRNKDAKGTRMFRFALVEFVKDILRPTWKEGQLSKEAHKTIVKKVVDKVVVTLDTNIPHTQERIDLYLSYSKEKLTKLVQAYMEKYLKT